MYDICHPVYYNMSKLGCNDQVKLTTAFYVYIELCEVKRYWNVEYKYCDSLQLFYLLAKKTKNSILDIFIPWTATKNITLDFISDIENALNNKKFTFVFKEGDTTSVYYTICSGIRKPTSPEQAQILKQKNEKKFKLEREINRNISNLYERALSIHNEEIQSSRKLSDDLKEENSDLNFFTAVDTMCSNENTEITELKNSVNAFGVNSKNVVQTCIIIDKSETNNIHKNGSMKHIKKDSNCSSPT